MRPMIKSNRNYSIVVNDTKLFGHPNEMKIWIIWSSNRNSYLEMIQ